MTQPSSISYPAPTQQLAGLTAGKRCTCSSIPTQVSSSTADRRAIQTVHAETWRTLSTPFTPHLRPAPRLGGPLLEPSLCCGPLTASSPSSLPSLEVPARSGFDGSKLGR